MGKSRGVGLPRYHKHISRAHMKSAVPPVDGFPVRLPILPAFQAAFDSVEPSRGDFQLRLPFSAFLPRIVHQLRFLPGTDLPVVFFPHDSYDRPARDDSPSPGKRRNPVGALDARGSIALLLLQNLPVGYPLMDQRSVQSFSKVHIHPPVSCFRLLHLYSVGVMPACFLNTLAK